MIVFIDNFFGCESPKRASFSTMFFCRSLHRSHKLVCMQRSLNFFIDIVHSSTSKPVFFALVGEGEDTLAGFGLAEDSGHAQVHPVVESQGA